MHTAAFTHKKNYAQKLLHTEAFTARQTETFTQSCFYPEQLLHTHTHVYTQKFSNTKAFAHGSVYGAQNLLDREAFTHRNFDTEKSYTEEL